MAWFLLVACCSGFECFIEHAFEREHFVLTRFLVIEIESRFLLCDRGLRNSRDSRGCAEGWFVRFALCCVRVRVVTVFVFGLWTSDFLGDVVFGDVVWMGVL